MSQRRQVWLPKFFCGAAVCMTPLFAQQTAQPPQVQNAAPDASFHEEVLGELSPGSELQSARNTAHHLAWVEKQAGKRTVRWDGKQQGGVYDDAEFLHFTPDEQHLIFAAKRHSKWVFIEDGQEHTPEYSSVTSVAFQPKGNASAYCGCREKKCRLVVNGMPTGEEYEEISYPQYSPDGKRTGYLGKRGKKWVAVVDGKELGPEVDGLDFDVWGFSPDGTRFYAAARIKRNWMYVVDGTAGPPFDVVSPISFTSDGKHYAYAGTEARHSFGETRTFGTLILDGEPKDEFEGSGFGSALQAFGGVHEVIARGVRIFSANFHGLSSPEFNPDGNLVYAARRGFGDVAVFVGAKAGVGFDDIVSLIIFTPDAKHFAYIAQVGDDFVEVRDNHSGAKFPGKRKRSLVSWIAMSEDATHFAYEIVRGGTQFEYGRTHRALRRVVIDGQAGPEYDALRLTAFRFTKNVAHYGYEVHGVEGDRDRVVVDGHESKLFDSVFSSSLHYDADNKTFWFVARDGQKFLRVSVAVP